MNPWPLDPAAPKPEKPVTMPNTFSISPADAARSAFEKLMGLLGGPAPATEPKDSPGFMAGCAAVAKTAADAAARSQKCQCARCKLTIHAEAVSAFMWTETLRAAVTGDTSKLAAVAAKVEELRAAS